MYVGARNDRMVFTKMKDRGKKGKLLYENVCYIITTMREMDDNNITSLLVEFLNA